MWAALSSAALSAEAPAGQAGSVPSDILVPNDEARAFFAALERPGAAEQLLNEVPPAMTAALEAAVEATLARGEQVTGWNSSGEDLRAFVAAKPADSRVTCCGQKAGSDQSSCSTTFPSKNLCPRAGFRLRRLAR
jgi:hypothetical protein